MLILLWACQSIPEEAVACNLLPNLCEQRVSDVLFAGTHNSMSSQEEEWIAPNHRYAIPRQLQDGIRALNIDTYYWEDEAYMCHSFCEIGAQPLLWATEAIADYVEQEPQTVLIITFQSSISASDTLGAFEQAGLDSERYHHEQGSPWPTLQELIDNRTRLILFSNYDGGHIDGYMSQWEHWIDNPYSAQEVSDFACHPDRGDLSTATLYNVNHFLTNPVALESLAQEANQQDVLRAHLEQCKEETGLTPNQLLVDFYSIGSVLEIVREENLRLPKP
ncbi:MAG: hypothetical protein VX278_11795 [Myxococcota bacterium]|nr:hypothetical protein [Myxococcota bacterium]